MRFLRCGDTDVFGWGWAAEWSGDSFVGTPFQIAVIRVVWGYVVYISSSHPVLLLVLASLRDVNGWSSYKG